MPIDSAAKDKIRLSDRILSALELALSQEDLKTSELLTRAIEMAMTRNTGGGEFIERREYPPELEAAMDRLDILRKSQS